MYTNAVHLFQSIKESVMKFAPIYVVATLLLLSGCSLPAPDVSAASKPKIILETGGAPNPAQTTWSTPEPAQAVQSPETAAQKGSDAQTSTSTLTSVSCGEIDPVLIFRFERSFVKCPELLALRTQLIEEVGEGHVDGALLRYHEEYCTEHGGTKPAEPLPYSKPSEPEFYEKPVDPYRDLKGGGVANADSLEMNLGKYVPCRTPEEVAKQ